MSDNANNKFEQMLEKLTADDRAGAEALFHEIVVEKSRSIYENLLESDLAEIAVEETAVEEAKKDKEMKKADKEDSKEEMKKESTEEVAAETIAPEAVAPVAVAPVTAEVGGDASDDMIADIEDEKDAEDKGEEKPEAADMEDKIVDLEDAVEELKAEFEKLMSNEGDKEDAKDGEGDKEAEKEAVATEVQPNAEEAAPVATSELGTQPVQSEDKSEREKMREYVDKVAVKHADHSDNAKSPTPKQAKSMGGKVVDIAGSEEKGRPAPKAETNDAGNINVPGASIKLVKAKGPETADKSDNSTSVLGSK
jgi:hypothetical protein